MTSRPYLDYATWMSGLFSFKVQILPLNIGLTCPNRDGTLGYGGCTFCHNEAFAPAYTQGGDFHRQIEAGKRFFKRKYKRQHFLPYLQSYSNTYAPADYLASVYEEIVGMDDVAGIVIATRPDCVDEPLLDILARLREKTFVMVEYGIESANDRTLAEIHRGHDFECCRKAIRQTADRGIYVGGHVILGLPNEDAEESIRQASVISSLPIHTLKIHHLQIIRETVLANSYEKAPFHVYTLQEFLELVAAYVERLRPDIALQRFVSQVPPRWLIAPRWGVKSQAFSTMLREYMSRHNMYQGRLWEGQ